MHFASYYEPTMTSSPLPVDNSCCGKLLQQHACVCTRIYTGGTRLVPKKRQNSSASNGLFENTSDIQYILKKKRKKTFYMQNHFTRFYCRWGFFLQNKAIFLKIWTRCNFDLNVFPLKGRSVFTWSELVTWSHMSRPDMWNLLITLLQNASIWMHLQDQLMRAPKPFSDIGQVLHFRCFCGNI